MSEQWHLFLQELKETGLLQWIAVVFGMAEVLFAKFNKIWLYPCGIIGTVLTIYLYIEPKLYAEALLNVYYVVMSIYGWWFWVKKKDKPPVKITFTNRAEWLIVAAIALGGTAFTAFILAQFTSSNVPFWDAFVSATAWAGTWLLAKRKVENWVLLNISNAVAVPLLFSKHLPLFALLTAFLFIVATIGYFDWKKSALTDKSASLSHA